MRYNAADLSCLNTSRRQAKRVDGVPQGVKQAITKGGFPANPVMFQLD
jgi:hypothetical protein